MKIKNNVIGKISLSSSLAVALAIGVWLPVGANAQASSYSTKPWLHLQHVQTEKEFGQIPEGATVAMACTKCKSVTVISQQWKTTKPSQGTIERELTVHECPGCGGKMTTELKQTKMIHTCSKCGDDSAFCCATKPGAGATKGMEKEQK